MFKAKFIENNAYYQLRRRQLMLLLLTAIPAGLIVNFYRFSLPIILAITGIYLGGIIWMAKNQKRITQLRGNKYVEFDGTEIRIRSEKHEPTEVIQLAAVENIVLNKYYGMPQENMKEVANELKGNARKNYLLLYHNNRQRQIHFEVESYYMLNQLNSIVEDWKKNGYPVETA